MICLVTYSNVEFTSHFLENQSNVVNKINYSKLAIYTEKTFSVEDRHVNVSIGLVMENQVETFLIMYWYANVRWWMDIMY